MTRTHTPATNILRGAARRLRPQDGQTLILALSIVTVLMVSTAATVEIVRAGQVNSSRERQASRTLAIGEAGLDKAVYAVSTSDVNATMATGSTIPSTAYSFDGGTGTYSALKNADGSWTVTANATSPDGRVTRQVQETIDPHTTTTGSAISPVYAYGFFMADPTPDCTVISTTGNSLGNSANVTVPVYVAGSLCLNGGGSPLISNPSSGSKISLYVGGKYQTSGNSSPVGSSTNRLAKATIVGGCQVSFHGWKNVICSTPGVPTSGTGSGIWADSYSSTPLSLAKPALGTIEADAAYNTAAPGPTNACGTGSTVGSLRFDTNTTRDTSVGTVRLLKITGTTTGNNFDCRFYDASNNLVGRLAYTYGSPGALTVLGTIFIDGNLSFSGNDTAVYSGTGTIYVNGKVTFSNGARLCGAPMSGGDCSGNWDPASGNSLEIVAINANNAATAWDNSGDGQFEGTAFMNGRYVAGNSAWVQGPVIADSGQLSGAANFKAISSPPPGAPGASTLTSTTNWAAVPGSWRQCPTGSSCPAIP
jgi:hypothetical protein